MYKFVRNFKQKDPNKGTDDVSSSSSLTLNTTSNNNNTTTNSKNIEQSINSNKIPNIEQSTITATTSVLPNKSAEKQTTDRQTLNLNTPPSARTPFTKIKNTQANTSKLNIS